MLMNWSTRSTKTIFQGCLCCAEGQFPSQIISFRGGTKMWNVPSHTTTYHVGFWNENWLGNAAAV